MGYIGRCENWFRCVSDPPNIIMEPPPPDMFHCADGEVFAQSRNSCIPYDESTKECKPIHDPYCTEAGIFRDPRNCAQFHVCAEDSNGGFHDREEYQCPDGWLFDDGTGTQNPPNTCNRAMNNHQRWHEGADCPFPYNIVDPVPLDDTTQCHEEGLFRDENNERFFIHCKKHGRDDVLGQIGP